MVVIIIKTQARHTHTLPEMNSKGLNMRERMMQYKKIEKIHVGFQYGTNPQEPFQL